MITIKTIEIFGFLSAITALRLPFKSSKKSDTTYINKFPVDNDLIAKYDINMGSNDLKLMSALVKNGDEHAKCIRGIIVSCIITAPRYFWQEMSTYRFGCECLSSESTMHSECKGMSGEELQKAKAEITEGLEQSRVYQFSYQKLRSIYRQRNTHRLPEWQEFCNWIKTLPYSKELILGDYYES